MTQRFTTAFRQIKYLSQDPVNTDRADIGANQIGTRFPILVSHGYRLAEVSQKLIMSANSIQRSLLADCLKCMQIAGRCLAPDAE